MTEPPQRPCWSAVATIVLLAVGFVAVCVLGAAFVEP